MLRVFQVTLLQVSLFQKLPKSPISCLRASKFILLLPPSTRAPRLRCLTLPPQDAAGQECASSQCCGKIKTRNPASKLANSCYVAHPALDPDPLRTSGAFHAKCF